MLTVDYDKLSLTDQDVVLDLGCGFGRHAYGAAARGARVIASDLSLPELIDIRSTLAAMHLSGEVSSENSLELAASDACRLPFGNESFTKIIASEVLEHIPHDQQAIAELARVLRPGGMLAVTVPAWLPEKLCWMLDEGYSAPQAVGDMFEFIPKATLSKNSNLPGLFLSTATKPMRFIRPTGGFVAVWAKTTGCASLITSFYAGILNPTRLQSKSLKES